METLKDSINNQDYNKASSSAHKMKSSFMLMGAEWAKDLCLSMESIVKEGTETQKLSEIYKELSSKFLRMVELLKVNN